jgi:hypothetical protein
LDFLRNFQPFNCLIVMKELLEALAKASSKQIDILDQLLAYARAREEPEIAREKDEARRKEREIQRDEERETERKKDEARREEREIQRDEERETERKKDEARREEREMQRDEEREIERKKDEARREEREIQRDKENARRLNYVHFTLQSLVSRINGQTPLQPIPLTTSSSPFSASGSTGASSHSSTSSRQTSSPENCCPDSLRKAFAESESESKYDVSGLIFPVPVERLIERGVLFAHRVACKGGIGESKDFDIALEGMETILLPPNEGTTSKKGLSFFIPLSNSSIMLQASHDFQNAKYCLCYPLNNVPTGMTLTIVKYCLCYPLNNVPTGMTLTIDKVHVYDSADEAIAKKPIMLHAYLSTNERIPVRDFMTAVDSWSGRQLCSISASADIIDNLQYHNTIDGLQNELTDDDDDDDDIDEIC